MAPTSSKRLSFELTAEQLRKLKPILDETGRVDILASIDGSQLKIALLACQAAFTPDIKISSK